MSESEEIIKLKQRVKKLEEQVKSLKMNEKEAFEYNECWRIRYKNEVNKIKSTCAKCGDKPFPVTCEACTEKVEDFINGGVLE